MKNLLFSLPIQSIINFNTKNLISLLVIFSLITSCHKDDNNQSTDGKVTIKGTITAAGSKKLTGTKGSDPVSIADARKVMVFRGSQYSISDIVDSSFTVTADEGTANALVFLNSENKFIGVLCTEGLNVLPLVGLTDGDKTVIDLEKLTMPGDSIVPMHNPFGDEIDISEKELENLRAVGSYYESLADNIDADKDGQLDMLTNKQVTIIFHYNLYVGKTGLDNTPPTAINASGYLINYGVEFAGGKGFSAVDNTAKLSGPAGDESTDIFLWGYANDPGSNWKFLVSFNRQGEPIPGSPMGNNFLPFKDGIYTFSPYAGTDLKLHFSNVDARENLIIISPTLKTDGNGKILSVEFKYSLPDGSPVNPEKLISDFMIQFINTENKQFLVVRPVAEHGYYKFTFPSPVDLTTFKGMDLFYYDLLGNYYNNNWSR
jgi:hypothetical protein